MRAANILQIIPELETGGAERTVVEMTEAIVRAGGGSYVVTKGGPLCEQLEALGGEVILMDVATKNPLKIYQNSRKIGALIDEKRIDLVHARSRAPAWSGLWAARAKRVPFVTTYHGAYNQKSALKGFYNGVMARGDWVIANSQFTADLIKQRHPVTPDRIKVIYRGVDVVGMDPAVISEDRLDQLRRDWGLDALSHDKVILQAARLTEWKGQRDVIEAARVLKTSLQGNVEKAKLASVKFILAGDCQGRVGYENELKSLIKTHGLEDCVYLVGHVKDIAAAYKLADIVVVASREAEAFGRTAAEAQAMGCPVIATDIGAPPEFLNLGSNDIIPTAWLVPVADGNAIAEHIQKLSDLDTDLLDEMSVISRQYVEERFTAERMKSQTIEIYEDLLGGSLARIG